MVVKRAFGGLMLGVCVLVVGACGSSSSKSSSVASSSASSTTPSGGTSLNISVKELDPGSVAFTVPASIKAGLVKIQLTNAGRKPHAAQIIRVDPGHTVEDAYKVIAGNTNTSPLWLHGAGGVGATDAGGSNSAQVVLSSGTYYLLDAGMNTSRGFGKFVVQGGGAGAALPPTPATITALETGPKRSTFKISGLKAGDNAIRFVSPSSNKDLHQFAAIELRPGASLAAVKKFLSSRKPSGPPPFAGRPGGGGHDAAVVDPGLGEIANVNLKAGSSYALVCFLSDREGGPPHFSQGMLAKVDIK
ncbi:MAG: hypothetical protein NVSMB51_12730 [Solirubrobacteraceae bacterium]